MQKLIHKSSSRGHANHGWLNTYHTFSFAGYHNPERVQFGALRVLNDDEVAGGTGFGTHPHDNMEIVTIMLSGELRHADSMGHSQVLREGEVQAMSAGTGITHSEKNNLPDKPARLLQIWVFPMKQNTVPRYEQKAFEPDGRRDKWQLLVGPDITESALNIGQQAWFSRNELSKGQESNYSPKEKTNGVYFFVIEGSATVADEVLQQRDGMGIWKTDYVSVVANENCDILAIEVPFC